MVVIAKKSYIFSGKNSPGEYPNPSIIDDQIVKKKHEKKWQANVKLIEWKEMQIIGFFLVKRATHLFFPLIANIDLFQKFYF